MSTFKDIQCKGNANVEGNLNVQGEINKFVPNLFINGENMFDKLEIGNLRGGTLVGARCVKYGRVVFLYAQINGITAGGGDVEIFRFKDQHLDKYAPANYAVFPAFINIADCAVYIGQFADGHFSMAIMDGSLLNSNNLGLIIFTATYITRQ